MMVEPTGEGAGRWVVVPASLGDGRTVCTAALQRAVDTAAAARGTVYVPAGVYVTGTLELRSHLTLELSPGAVLLGSPDLADYPAQTERLGDRHGRHLLLGRGLTGLSIRGGGTIDGNGPCFWESTPQDTLARTWIAARPDRVSPMIELVGCTDLCMENVRIVNSPGWTVHLRGCDRVQIRSVTLLNEMFGPNTDGFDINGCRDVRISDCHIECGDDAIVLKTTRDSRSCERVVVTNCIVRSNCAALKCGTESWHDFRQICFSNCVVFRSQRAIGLYMFDGAVIEDVAISNIVCDTDCGFVLCRPIHFDVRKRPPRAGPHDSRPLEEQPCGTIRHVSVSNLVARTDGRVLLTAADGCGMEDITLRDVQLRYPEVDDPVPTAPTARSAQFSNASPEARAARAAVVADGVARLRVQGLRIRWPEPGVIDPTWAAEGKIENGSTRRFERVTTIPPMHAVWLRNVTESLVETGGLRASLPGVALADVAASDVDLGQ